MLYSVLSSLGQFNSLEVFNARITQTALAEVIKIKGSIEYAIRLLSVQ